MKSAARIDSCEDGMDDLQANEFNRSLGECSAESFENKDLKAASAAPAEILKA